MSLAAAAQGNTNNALANLTTLQAQHRQNGLNNALNANRDLISEGDKVYQDRLNDYIEKTDARNVLLQSSLQNKFGAFHDFGNGLMMAGSYMNRKNNPANEFSY